MKDSSRDCFPASRRQKTLNAFTLLELIIVVVIIGILSSISISLSLSVIRREQVNSIALGFAGWFENIRQISAKRVSSIDSQGGCTITFSATSASNLQSGSLLAELDSQDARCGESAPDKYQFRIPSGLNGTYSFAVYSGSALIPAPLKFTFTPRGVWISDPPINGDIELRFLRNDTGPLRCMLITATLATVEIGQKKSSSIDQSCIDYEAF